uniref:Uncharacterized protein n=1 Tax=Neovison vison TaxID=452646 RepID=A0A8C7ES64_NEOVI
AMQAPDDGAGGAKGGAGAPAGPRGPGEPEGCDGTAAEGTVAGGASELEGASPAPRHGEDASALASGEASGSQLLELYPFEGAPGTGGEARGAQGLLHPQLFPFPLTFSKLTAKDSALLQISTATLLNQLSTVIQTMQHFVPPFFVSR